MGEEALAVLPGNAARIGAADVRVPAVANSNGTTATKVPTPLLGKRVFITGLPVKPELNGRTGTLTS